MNAPALALRDAGGELTRGRLTLTQAAQAFLRWASAHGYAKNTLVSYGFGLSEFLRYAAGVKLTTPSEVTILALDGYFVWLQVNGASARTASHRRSVLVALWTWLEHEGFADRNIAAKTFRIKFTTRAPVYLEGHQIDGFLGTLAALTDPLGRRDHAIAATLFYTGLRVGELAALTRANVDLVASRVKVLHGKGDKDRTVVLPPRLAPILRAYLADTRPALLARPMGSVYFYQRRGCWRIKFTQDGRTRTRDFATEAEARQALARLSPPQPSTPMLFVVKRRGGGVATRAGLGLLERAIYKIIRDRARSVLDVKLSPHKLRHTCASYLLAGGAQLETIQRHLGHADVKTTMIYLHVPQRRQADEIGRVFA